MSSKIGRNDYCPCKSGLKFKRCCIDKPLNLFPLHTPERRHHWTPREIAEIPTDKIIEKLELCGISITQAEFLIDVHNHNGSGDIAKKWQNQFVITATGFDDRNSENRNCRNGVPEGEAGWWA
jgi:kynurenine formamidase